MRKGALIHLAGLTIFTIVFVRNAWVVDDAYISFRSVENFVSGHGLVWNLGERVQVYSHPLWMFLLSALRAFGADFFYGSLALSYLLCIATFAVAGRSRARDEWWRLILVLLGFLSSKAVVDYSSSGLENPLSYFVAAIFLAMYWRPASEGDRPRSERQLFLLLLIAALAAFNRLDTVILFLPALLLPTLERARISRLRAAGIVLLATLPATVWVAFSCVYYGAAVPNPAIAKLLATGAPIDEKLLRGLEYLGNSLSWDPASHWIVAGSTFLAWRQRCWPALWMLAGVAAYYAFVVVSAASATHMSGRFFAVPVLVAILVGARLVPGRQVAAIVASIAGALVLFNPHSPLRMGTDWYADSPQDHDHIDTNWYVHREGAALLGWFGGRELPDHDWFHAGRAFRDRPERVSVGADGGVAIGYFAFAAGPAKFVIDYAALTDPLLARLPACNVTAPGSWRSGHFLRSLPPGYLESVETGENRIEDPGLRAYYEVIRSVTRGPLFSGSRLLDVAKLNLGMYDSLKTEYSRAARGHCRIPVRRRARASAPGLR